MALLSNFISVLHIGHGANGDHGTLNIFVVQSTVALELMMLLVNPFMSVMPFVV